MCYNERMSKTITLSLDGMPVFRRMPGGDVMLPMDDPERAALASALRTALRYLEPVKLRDATESDQR